MSKPPMLEPVVTRRPGGLGLLISLAAVAAVYPGLSLGEDPTFTTTSRGWVPTLTGDAASRLNKTIRSKGNAGIAHSQPRCFGTSAGEVSHPAASPMTSRSRERMGRRGDADKTRGQARWRLDD